jgi:hypothetical protein
MSSPAPAVPAKKDLPKVLRIGLVVEGKIAQERLVRHGDNVTVGEGAKNTFSIAGTKLPPRHELFVFGNGAYVLQVPEGIEGKIQWRDGIKSLEELRPQMSKRGSNWALGLTENVRGKLTLGSVTVLFQFVPPPPEPLRAASAADFRPRLFDEDDPLFLGLLGLFSVVAAALMVFVYFTPMPERLDTDALEDAVDLVVEKQIEQVKLQDPNQVPEAKAEEKKPEAKDEKKAEAAAEKAAPKPADAESVTKKSLLLQMLGTAGEGEGDAANIIGDDVGMQSVDEALNGVSGVQAAQAGDGGIKGGSARGAGDASVGVTTATGGGSGTGTGTVKVKKAKLDLGDADATAEAGDVGGIRSVVKANNGRIVSCLDQALKQNPDLNGRISIGWTIQAGKVTSSSVVRNNTGDDALANCMAKAVRSFRFDAGLTAEVAEFPFAVSGQ